MTYQKLLKKAKDEARKIGKEETAVFYLLLEATKMKSQNLYMNFDSKVSELHLEKFLEYKDKYLYDNIPVQYLIGHVEFLGYQFTVNNNVLIPRMETEELVENTLYLYDEYFKDKAVTIADIGTGSGCIAVSLKNEIEKSKVYATDISAEALKVARENSILNDAKIEFLKGDMLEPIIEKNIKLDILISNPPYIPNKENVDTLVKDNEPNIALFGGEDGLFFYHRILENASKVLNDKFIIGFEHAFDKKDEIKKIIRHYFNEALIKQLKDINGKDRMTFIIGGF